MPVTAGRSRVTSSVYEDNVCVITVTCSTSPGESTSIVTILPSWASFRETSAEAPGAHRMLINATVIWSTPPGDAVIHAVPCRRRRSHREDNEFAETPRTSAASVQEMRG